jgi:hypothetical protein
LEAYTQSLGAWGYNHKIEDLLEDLIINSGIIIIEFTNQYSFGHLSFQEHLAGEYLFEQNFSLNKLKSLLYSDWWREPLLFYASIKGDITDLVENLSRDNNILNYIDLLSRMIEYAPYTSPGVKEILNEFSKQLFRDDNEFNSSPSEIYNIEDKLDDSNKGN